MKKIILIMIAMFFAPTVQAKVLYGNSYMSDMHLNTIKGMLYDMTHNGGASDEANREETQKNLLNFSKAIVWLTSRHNDSAVYKLEKLHNEEARLIKDIIAVIGDVLEGKYEGFPVELAMQRWTSLGSNVIAEYRVIPNNTNSSAGPQVIWKLELKEREAETQNLVLKHEAEVVQITYQK
jgi:hypothetical protein